MDMDNLTEHLSAFAPFLGTAMIGCVLQALKGRWMGWKNFALSAASAGFGAHLTFQLVGDVFSPGWGQFVSGMVGYSGGTLVDVALEVAKQYIENFKPKQKAAGPNDTMED